jgi:hypothetical protein
MAILDISGIRYLYRQYPEFVAACERITQESLAAGKTLTEQQNAMVSTMVQSHREEGTPLPELSELRRQREEIWTTRNQRIMQAYKDHGVPLFQKWNEALETTGKATYYEVDHQPGRSRTVTLTKAEDGGVILEMHLTQVYPNERCTPDQIENRLALEYYLNAQAWEVVVEPQKAGSPELRIAARAMADAKFHLATSTDPDAPALADAEYKRLMEDYARNGENSELARLVKDKTGTNWARGLEKPGNEITLVGLGAPLTVQRREDMRFDVSTPKQTLLQGATESEVSALLAKLGYNDSMAVSWP